MDKSPETPSEKPFIESIADLSKNIDLTPQAIEYLITKLKQRGTPQASIRLGVRGSGCNGFSYVIEFDDKTPSDRDNIFNFGELKIVVDKKSIIYLRGCQLDYEKTLIHSGLKFKNPNEISSCSCGESFTVK